MCHISNSSIIDTLRMLYPRARHYMTTFCQLLTCEVCFVFLLVSHVLLFLLVSLVLTCITFLSFFCKSRRFVHYCLFHVGHNIYQTRYMVYKYYIKHKFIISVSFCRYMLDIIIVLYYINIAYIPSFHLGHNIILLYMQCTYFLLIHVGHNNSNTFLVFIQDIILYDYMIYEMLYIYIYMLTQIRLMIYNTRKSRISW